MVSWFAASMTWRLMTGRRHRANRRHGQNALSATDCGFSAVKAAACS